MKLRIWPRTIRYQLLAGLVLLEAMSLVLFASILVHQQSRQIQNRAQQRLMHQAALLALHTQEDLESDHPEAVIASNLRMTADAPSVAAALITDANGKVLYSDHGDSRQQTLSPAELAALAGLARKKADGKPQFLQLSDDDWDGVKSIVFHGKLYGYVWVKTDRAWDQEQVTSTIQSTTIFGVIWIAASILLAWGLSRSITRQLKLLHRGTQALMHSPEGASHFPLPVVVDNEIGDLILAFNRMVASIEEQRTGLHETLSLLDSMLANAPIGLAFFDSHGRFVRVNQVFCEATGLPIKRHLRHTLHDVLTPGVALQLDGTIRSVFSLAEPVKNLEVSGIKEGETLPWTWIVSAYPILITPDEVRWAGLIVLDASDRKRSEEALRKNEKLAATGRLAASIAHEINNPLEAITNLLYLLLNHAEMDEPARGYAVMAEHEVKRIAEITQQTLRFYRQSTLPTRSNLAELLDSVLGLHQARLRNLGIRVERRYDPTIDLYCFAGELRQVFANLIGNAIDAMPKGGNLIVRARRSRDWSDPVDQSAPPDRCGVRFFIADSGMGMKPNVRKRIFEPFYTTKEVTGTGLGLWVSSELIAKHQASVRVRSREISTGRPSGTVFALFFPDSAKLDSLPTIEAQVATGAQA